MELYQEYLNLINYGTLKQKKQLPREVNYDFERALKEVESKASSIDTTRKRKK